MGAPGPLLFLNDDPKSIFSESMRVLRTNLQYVDVNDRLKTLLITSAAPSEGKTVVSANLAASCASSGVSTILVGVDLRKPTIHHIFNLDNKIGLTNVLVGQATVEDALIESGVNGLRLMLSGPIPPNPAEIIGSKKMSEVVSQLSDMADLVIFDSPPVLAVTDSLLLASMASGTLLVVDMNHTHREMVKRAKDQLNKVKANIIGVVANRVNTGASHYHYYDYYGESDQRGNAKITYDLADRLSKEGEGA